MGKQLMSIKGTAEFLDISISTLRRIILREEIPVVKIGRIYRIDRSDILEYIEKQRGTYSEVMNA